MTRSLKMRTPYSLALLLSLLFLFIGVPLLTNDTGKTSQTMHLALVMMQASCILMVSRHTKRVIVLAVTGLPAIVCSFMIAVLDSSSVLILSSYAYILFFGCVIVYMIQSILRSRAVDGHLIISAINIYMLIGVVFGFLYMIINRYQPEDLGMHIYFSLVVLTTMGFGDIVPASRLAQMMTAIEVICGQIYLAVLVARLVGMHLVHSGTRRTMERNVDDD